MCLLITELLFFLTFPLFFLFYFMFLFPSKLPFSSPSFFTPWLDERPEGALKEIRRSWTPAHPCYIQAYHTRHVRHLRIFTTGENHKGMTQVWIPDQWQLYLGIADRKTHGQSSSAREKRKHKVYEALFIFRLGYCPVPRVSPIWAMDMHAAGRLPRGFYVYAMCRLHSISDYSTIITLPSRALRKYHGQIIRQDLCNIILFFYLGRYDVHIEELESNTFLEVNPFRPYF